MYGASLIDYVLFELLYNLSLHHDDGGETDDNNFLNIFLDENITFEIIKIPTQYYSKV